MNPLDYLFKLIEMSPIFIGIISGFIVPLYLTKKVRHVKHWYNRQIIGDVK